MGALSVRWKSFMSEKSGEREQTLAKRSWDWKNGTGFNECLRTSWGLAQYFSVFPYFVFSLLSFCLLQLTCALRIKIKICELQIPQIPKGYSAVLARSRKLPAELILARALWYTDDSPVFVDFFVSRHPYDLCYRRSLTIQDRGHCSCSDNRGTRRFSHPGHQRSHRHLVFHLGCCLNCHCFNLLDFSGYRPNGNLFLRR